MIRTRDSGPIIAIRHSIVDASSPKLSNSELRSQVRQKKPEGLSGTLSRRWSRKEFVQSNVALPNSDRGVIEGRPCTPRKGAGRKTRRLGAGAAKSDGLVPVL
jgi:hypothetical protein